jgi:hypothetical protein
MSIAPVAVGGGELKSRVYFLTRQEALNSARKRVLEGAVVADLLSIRAAWGNYRLMGRDYEPWRLRSWTLLTFPLGRRGNSSVNSMNFGHL